MVARYICILLLMSKPTCVSSAMDELIGIMQAFVNFVSMWLLVSDLLDNC